jgi:hypothetical protein
VTEPTSDVDPMPPFLQATRTGGDSLWRPAPAALLADACRHYLSEASSEANEASRNLETLAGHVGISRDQARRLRAAAGAASMAAQAADRLRWELLGS